MSTGEVEKLAVFTALFGGYETLNNDQFVGVDDVSYICFTDDPQLVSDVWDLRLVEPMFPGDLMRSQRAIKLRGHADLDIFRRTLYIDNSVSLLRSPCELLDEWLRGVDLALAFHSFRDTVLDEFLEVLKIGLDEPTRVYEQLYQYSENAPEILDERPLWGGMIARRNTPAVNSAMCRWFDEVLRYSRRDQLSANLILGGSGVNVRRVEWDNNSTDWHCWPVELSRKRASGVSARLNGAPPIALIRELERELERVREEAATEVAAATAAATAMAKREAELRSTRSWRIAQGLSRIGSRLHLSRRRPSQK